MKYQAKYWLMFRVMMKKPLSAVWPRKDLPRLMASAKVIYRDLLSKVEGVSAGNPMSSNIYMAFIIVAVWLASERRLTPEQLAGVMDRVMDSPAARKMYGRYDANTAEGLGAISGMMHKNADWLAAHPENDANAWDFHFDEDLHRDGFCYHFTRCPIADFCRKYGYQEINPVLCNLDYRTFALMHGTLRREHTLAAGGGLCDYWIVGDRNGNPV